MDGAGLHGNETKPFEISGKYISIETMVHDALGVILMEGAVFFIRIGQVEDAARFQALKEFC